MAYHQLDTTNLDSFGLIARSNIGNQFIQYIDNATYFYIF